MDSKYDILRFLIIHMIFLMLSFKRPGLTKNIIEII